MREGQEPPGNLVISSDPDVISKAKSLWAAYDCGPEQLTVAIATNKPCSSANVCVWWKTQGKNQIASPNRVQLQLTQIGTAPGPVPVSAVVAEILKAKGPKLTIVRFLAPAFYRRHISGISKDDDPATETFRHVSKAIIGFRDLRSCFACLWTIACRMRRGT